MANTEPIEFTSVSQTYKKRAEIVEIVWSGATSAGNDVILRAINGPRIWRGRASGTDTYQGVSLRDGIIAPNGLELEALDGGTLMVYIKKL